MKAKKALFFDATGTYTVFDLYPLETQLPDTAGVYIYISDHYSDYRALYIDETENLNKMQIDAKAWQCVMGRFANAIGIHIEADRARLSKVCS